MLSEKDPKNIERERGEVFAQSFFDFFWDASHETPAFETILDGRGPKLVSKVSDSYDAVQQKSKKHHARAPPRAKSDDPLSKNKDFGTRPGIAGNRGESAETVAATAAPTPPNTRAGGQDDLSYANSLKLHDLNVIPARYHMNPKAIPKRRGSHWVTRGLRTPSLPLR